VTTIDVSDNIDCGGTTRKEGKRKKKDEEEDPIVISTDTFYQRYYRSIDLWSSTIMEIEKFVGIIDKHFINKFFVIGNLMEKLRC